MIKTGVYFKAKTTTKDDVFGDCIWRVVEDGLMPPEEERREAHSDGVKCILIGGTGPAARLKRGLSLRDSVWKINIDISNGTTEIISESEGKKFEEYYGDDSKPNQIAGGSGIEVDY